MELEHTFTVPVGIDDAWRVLTDIERIAPCMPGAKLDSVDGDDFTGTVKVKLGPINLTYTGKASFVEKDERHHEATIDARGRDARGNGTAAAKIKATLRESNGTTTVDVVTDLDITGKPAQFGRGVMVDVGNRLIGQFAERLEATLTDEGEAIEAETLVDGSAAVSAGEDAPSIVTIRPTPVFDDVEPIDLLSHAGPAVAKRLAPVVAVLAVIVMTIILRGARRDRRASRGR